MKKQVVIIGGGVIGSSIAWRLAREGAAVTVLERGRLGKEASWASAGMIAPQAEAQAAGPFFQLCLRARDTFEATLEMLRADTDIDPEYDRAGILYLALNDSERGELEQRAQWQAGAGGTVEELTLAAARQMEPAISPKTVYALYMPLERRIENRRLTLAYIAAAISKDAVFAEGVAAKEVLVKGSNVTGVRSDDGRIFEADAVINAAGAWSSDIEGIADTFEIYPVRGQIACFQTRPGYLHSSVFSLGGYLVPRRDGRILAGSTMEEAGFDKSVTLAGLAKISLAALNMAPALSELPFHEAWAGLRPAAKDFLPVLGASPAVPGFFYAAGHFRSGILLSAITGEIITDLVQARNPSIDIAPFSPNRFASSPKISTLALIRDILFRSRIDATAQALGSEVAYASDLEQALKRCSELRPAAVVVDLSEAAFPPPEAGEKIRAAAPQTRLIGFASHVDLKALNLARSAGFDLVLSRSEFMARLAELLKL
ncbi:MAG: glycine oxidase ThiO [Deltaproteobacteria bacterium]|nr:glycine oxidase ThiO [Deltaproteobacteria bacterium]MBV8451789.1 glycine oxidase ThiO [Deltaproteobacteria bacterium]